MHLIDPQDLVGCTFLLNEQDDGQRYRAKIVVCVTDNTTVRRLLRASLIMRHGTKLIPSMFASVVPSMMTSMKISSRTMSS